MTWEDAPSHICRGGDVRGLALCCPPVKPCPILNVLDEVNLTPQDYIDIKIQFARETHWITKVTILMKPLALKVSSMQKATN